MMPAQAGAAGGPRTPGTATRGETVPTVPPASKTAEAVDVTALLERGRTLATPVLRAAVDRLAPPMDTVAAYHFGWIDAQGRPAEGDGGKAVRPALAVLSAEVMSAAPETGIPGAGEPATFWQFLWAKWPDEAVLAARTEAETG